MRLLFKVSVFFKKILGVNISNFLKYNFPFMRMTKKFYVEKGSGGPGIFSVYNLNNTLEYGCDNAVVINL